MEQLFFPPDCPYKKSWMGAEIYNRGNYQYGIRLGYDIPEYVEPQKKKIKKHKPKQMPENNESYEEIKFKPMNKLDEGKLIDASALMIYSQLVDLGYKNSARQMILNNIDYINDHSNDNPSDLTDNIIKRWKRQLKKRDKEWENLKNESSEENKRNLSKEVFGKKFLELAQTYAGVDDLDIEVAYDKLMSDNRVFKLVDSTMSIEDIMDKISAGELLQ